MLRKIFTTAFLVATSFVGSTYGSDSEISIAEGLDGPSVYLIFVDTTSGPDVIEIKLSDDTEDGQLEKMKIEIRVNDDNDEGLPSLDEEIIVPAGEIQEVFLVVRSWEGADTCEVRSHHVDFPEAFTVYFSGGDEMDFFDASECDSHCWAHGDNDDDVLIGGTADDRLNGGDGLDYVDGGPGNDEITGGWDDSEDELIGGPGSDLLGKDVLLALPVGDGSVSYELLHTEAYLDFEPSEDEISFIELDEWFNQSSTWTSNSLKTLGRDEGRTEEGKDRDQKGEFDTKDPVDTKGVVDSKRIDSEKMHLRTLSR